MNVRKRKNIIIGVLCSLLVFMGIGYAALSQILTISAGGKIKGNWNINIESVTPINVKGDAKSIKNEVGSDKLTAVVNAELLKPDDLVTYKVVARNGGTINAKLEGAALSQKHSNKYVEISLDKSENDIGSVLTAGNSFTFNITIKCIDPDSTFAQRGEETISAESELQLNFVQVDSSGNPTTGGNGTSTEEPLQCFTVDSNGVLTDYNLACGTNVIVPVDVNGINVKTISSTAFKDFNIVTISSGETIVLFDDTYYNVAKQFMISLCLDNLSSSDDTSECNDTNVSERVIKKSTLSDTEYQNLITTNGVDQIFKLSVVDNEPELANAISPITSIDFSNALYLETIEDRAFVGMGNNDLDRYVQYSDTANGPLQAVNFGNITNLTSIGAYAFAGNRLTTVTLPSSSSSIVLGDRLFMANNLSTATINSNLTGDYNFMFTCNPSITSATLTLNNTNLTSTDFNFGTCSY